MKKIAALLLALLCTAAFLSSSEKSTAADISNSWSIHWEDIDIAALQEAPEHILILDYSHDGTDAKKISAAEIQKLHDSGKIVLASLSATNAEIWRFYWQSAWEQAAPHEPCTERYWRFPDDELRTRPCENGTKPYWLGAKNPKTGTYAVRFWLPEWFDLAIAPYLERINAAGFDGVYFASPDLSFWQSDAKQSYPQKFLATAVEKLQKHIKRIGVEKRKGGEFFIGKLVSKTDLELF